ncbi:hypothetical protein FNH22_14465 [Fulvivirga sp. M361]|uniref:hypothetical protein n=1 Tax=Fulvivirga sp. M361 TaxID=2594266 RepID=UPI00117B9FF4|nr:hypothetical protein [Fulvivirga sp. M361]TRX58258.1 hypothetical protein FNH22_14465 [Fulvivirga sp. M361]
MAEKNVEDQFRDRLGGYEEDPGDDAWGFIEKELPTEKTPWYRFILPAAVVLLLLTTGVVTWVWIDANQTQADTPVSIITDEDGSNREHLNTLNEQMALNNMNPEIADNDLNSSPLQQEINQVNEKSSGVKRAPDNRVALADVNAIKQGFDNDLTSDLETTRQMDCAAQVTDANMTGVMDENKAVERSDDKTPGVMTETSQPDDISSRSEKGVGHLQNRLAVADRDRNDRVLSKNDDPFDKQTTDRVDNSLLLTGYTQGRVQSSNGQSSDNNSSDRDHWSKHDFTPYALRRLDWAYTFDTPSPTSITRVGVTTTDGPKEEIRKKEKVDWSARRTTFYTQFMPTFTYNRVTTNQNDDQLIRAVEKIPAISVKRMGVRVEAGITHVVHPRLSLFAGALYFQRTQTINYYLQTVDSVASRTAGDALVITPGLGEEERSYEHQIQTLGIQVGGMYRLPGEKVASFIGTGMEIHKSLTKQSTDLFEEPDLYLFYNLFYRLEYPNDRRFRFLAQPTFNYSLQLSDDLSTPFYIQPYGFGLNFGFTLKL